MKVNKATAIIMAAVLSIGGVVAIATPTSAYIKKCTETGIDSEGYSYKRCITTSSDEGFQVFIVCVNIFQVGGTVYGNVAKSGGKSRVKCGFGTFPLNDNIYYRTVGL